MDPNIPALMMVPPSQRARVSEANKPEVVTGSTPATTIIRTMKGDSAQAIKEHGETLVSISLAEEKIKSNVRIQEKISSPAPIAPIVPTPSAGTITPVAPKPIGRIVVIVGLIFFVIAIVFAVVFLTPIVRKTSLSSSIFDSSSAKKAVTPTQKGVQSPSLSIIPAQFERRFITNKETPASIFKLISVERTAGGAPDTIKNLYFVEEAPSTDGKSQTTAIYASRLLVLAGTQIPDILMRSLEKPFMTGLLGETGNVATPFIVLKVSGYDTGFAGMLEWERDLPSFFDAVFGTKTTGEFPSLGKFYDITVSGRDARTLGGILEQSITYTFVNPNTIVIAGSRTALEKLIPMVPAR